MRSVIVVILSALALAGMFMLYWTVQPAARSVASTAPATPVFIPHESKDDERLNNLSGIHPGDVVWFKQYDVNQNLTNAFEAKTFVPHPDGTVYVTAPVAEFFLANRQRIEVVGKDGNVVVKDPPDLRRTGMMNTGPAAPPSRGRLNDVKITFYDEARPPAHQVVMTMTTNNVVFDNETYLIFTEGYRDGKGEAVPNDQVPVHVTGDDMEFHGRGLTLRWNDTDGRLELLEVAHGDVMEIKHPGHFTPVGSAQPKRRRNAAPAALLPGQPLPEMFAARGRKGEEEVIRHQPEPTTKPRRAGAAAPHASAAPVVYVASFRDQVVITQPAAGAPGNQLEITGDWMDVHFLMKQATSSTTGPDPQAAPVAPATAPAVVRGNPPPAPPTQPAATQPAEQPVFVHWSGILRIVPEKSTPPAPLAPGDAAITLVGAPVTVHHVDPAQQATEDVRCGVLVYQTAGEKVLLNKSNAYPHVLITDVPGPRSREQRATRIESTGSVQYGRVEQKVLLTGPGQAEVPVESDEKDKHPLLQAAWRTQALFDLTRPEGDEQPSVRQAHFAGDVDVRHPRLALKSQVLDLLFDPRVKPVPATRPVDGEPRPVQANLRQVIAASDVSCAVQDAEGKKQNIDCQRLVLDTELANEKIYPRHLNATGSVHAWGEDDLRAGYLDVVMAPSKRVPAAKLNAARTKPAKAEDTTQVELDSLLARENVVAKSKDGSIAEGQELRVTTSGGKQHVMLTSPSQATVTDPQGNIVSGPTIEADPDEGRAHVVGPGSIHLVQQKAQSVDAKAKANPNSKTAEPKKPMPPTDVTWLGAADFNGPENRIDVTGSVASRSIDRNGAVNTAVGEHMRIDLRVKPRPAATQPVVAAAAVAGVPKKERTKTPGSAAKMDLFGNKEMVALRIENGASLTSTLAAADGGILQQMQLNSTVIVVRELADDGAPSRRLTVPAPGTMLVRDHRPPEKQAAAEDANAAGGARGASAFEWHKQLVYAESTHRADMTGAVRVVHRDEDPHQPPLEVDAETVTAFFEPAPRKAVIDPKHPQQKQAEADEAPQLKLLTATGPTVQVIRENTQMIAQRIDYDPRKHLLTATGSPRNPVVFDTGGTQLIHADVARWDTLTWNPAFDHPIFVYRPPTPATQPADHPVRRKK